jgi:hypothetical protein
MYYISLLFFFLNSLVVFSCSPDDRGDKNLDRDYFISSKSFYKKSNPCPDSSAGCAEVNLIIPVVEHEDFSEFMNAEILKELEAIMENIPPPITSFQEINIKIDSFISQHKTLSEEINYLQNWSLNVRFKILENNQQSISLLIYSDRFTGGAHPVNAISILSFNPDNGKKRTFPDFINDEEKLKELIVKEVRKKRNIGSSASLTDEGFYADEWPLPLNYALLSKGLYMVYNAYEIGPYVLGSTELFIPLKDLKPLLKN